MEEENKEKEKEMEIEEKGELVSKQELEETTDRLKRVLAEFDNYKKRSSKEKELLYNSLIADIIEAFLPVMDNLQKAVQVKTEDDNYKTGVEMVLKQFEEVFAKFKVEKIETVGKTFDPEVHEAVSSVQDETLGEKEIKQEFRTGYRIGSRVIRHAMVVVAN